MPFDAKKRSPAERSEMAAKLGLEKVAYDWRGERAGPFEEEMINGRTREDFMAG